MKFSGHIMEQCDAEKPVKTCLCSGCDCNQCCCCKQQLTCAFAYPFAAFLSWASVRIELDAISVLRSASQQYSAVSVKVRCEFHWRLGRCIHFLCQKQHPRLAFIIIFFHISIFWPEWAFCNGEHIFVQVNAIRWSECGSVVQDILSLCGIAVEMHGTSSMCVCTPVWWARLWQVEWIMQSLCKSCSSVQLLGIASCLGCHCLG